MKPIREYIKDNVLLFDGAMGTYIAAKVKQHKHTCEELSFYMPDAVESIHREYVMSGAKAIKTNTFCANYDNISDSEALKQIIHASVACAKRAAEDKAYIFADIGPVKENYNDVADIFSEEGIDCFLFETLSDSSAALSAAESIKRKNPDSFIILSFAISPDGFTRTGRSGAALLKEALAVCDMAGFNCVCGPAHIERYIIENGLWNRRLVVMPNAGYPTVIGNRTYYGHDSEYFGEALARIASNPVGAVGGCCGTEPDHIRAYYHALPEELRVSVLPRKKMISRGENEFANKLRRGEKVIAVELDPPEDCDVDFFMNGAQKLIGEGVDIITIADCPVARARMDSSILACRLKREKNIEPLPHMTCRDRNINAIKALLLGLYAEGVRNVLIVTGDPVPSAERGEVKSVYNFNSRMLAAFIKTLNETTFETPMNVCAALNVNAVNFSVQLELAREKVKNGVSVLLSQPVMSKEALDNLAIAKRELDAKILCGVMPVVSYKNALYMNNEIPGISVCREIMELFLNKNRQECEKIGIRIAVETARAARDYCDGFYVVTPFRRVEMVLQIIREIQNFC
ncbi:MAG: bifunctional homocysteine S-methyltransferase/methylenetetrahydrofolate reductase [Clostridia bacterium]|nr:bifunctional homocysteine S-methyltransferase/methylenetetrahydrofolate reductase [Clostridia bacterium]